MCLVHDGGPSTFYLWLRATRAAKTGGRSHAASPSRGSWSRRATSTAPTVRRTSGSSLTQTDDRLVLAFERLAAKERV